MKSKIYSFRILAMILLIGGLCKSAGAQDTYFREGFTNTIGHFNTSSADPSVAVASPYVTAQQADYGEWMSYGFYLTTGGGGCVPGQDARHPRSVKITNGTLPWLATPLLTSGVGTLHFIPGANNNKYMTIEKTTSTATDPAGVAAATWVPVTAEFRMNNCGVDPGAGDVTNDTAVIVNDPAATRIRFVTRTNYQVDFDSVWIISTSPIAPVKFAGISAANVNGFTKVSWKIATEENTQSYIVEKSTNGASFNKSGEVIATKASSYSWIDNAAGAGVAFYRIKAVDKDGKLSYSSVVKISGKAGRPEFVIAPNVVRGRTLNLQISNVEKGNVELLVSNNSGQVVYRTSFVNEGGSVSKSIQLPYSLTAGTYRVQMATSGTMLTQTAVLQ